MDASTVSSSVPIRTFPSDRQDDSRTMRVQHNAANNNGRNCWKSGRERNRIKARYEIKKRILDGSDLAVVPPAAGQQACESCMPESWNIHTRESVQLILQRIIEGNRSFFSLQFMQKNHSKLSTPFSTEFVWQQPQLDDESDMVLLGEQQWVSRCGPAYVDQFKHWLVSIQEPCTFWEYAVWLKRYHVISSLIVGGINPCIRGRIQSTAVNDEERYDNDREFEIELSERIGLQARQRFMTGAVPLRLCSYIVKRITEMRFSCNPLADETSQCAVCSRQIPASFRQCYINESNDEASSCRHVICEPCLWNDLLDSMYFRLGDVVQCPFCETVENRSATDLSSFFEHDTSLSPIERSQETLQKYCQLPADSIEAKGRKMKAKTVSECDIMCSTWSEAFQSSLGISKSVRREKFFRYVESEWSFHCVNGCIDAGIDLSLTNEYGQTALFIATWRGDINLVRLLLHYGCDPCIPAQGGISCVQVARSKNYCEIAKHLENACNTETQSEVMEWSLPWHSPLTDRERSPPRLQNLIDWSSEHPGAGSFLLDDAMESHFIDSLISLWKTVPVAEECRKKNGLCSVRSYFCDAVGTVSAYLQSCLSKAFDELAGMVIFPHMRFLCYSHQGTELAPHIDLRRIDPFTGERSTHSFLLYLTTCDEGGETALLEDVAGEGSTVVLARAKPKRGRLLLFPHCCPHSGLAVVDVPKLLIRGEVLLRRKQERGKINSFKSSIRHISDGSISCGPSITKMWYEMITIAKLPTIS